MNPDLEPRLLELAEDHDAVLQLCDQVLTAARTDLALGEAQDAVLRLLDRVSEHVGAEQELMHTLAYPSGEAHAADHARLLELLAVLLSLSTGPRGPLQAAAGLFRESMEHHISTWDWNLADFVRQA